jgi:hypothetical protein
MTTKETWDVILSIATVLIAAGAAWKALLEFKLNRIQRMEDLRWKQAEAAKKLIDEWLTDEEAYDFCKMLEYENRVFINENGDRFSVNNDLITSALTTEDENINIPHEVNRRFVRDCLDAFLYFTELMQQGLQSNLYLLENLKFPLGYYVKKMKEVKLYQSINEYAKRYGYDDSIKLLSNFI